MTETPQTASGAPEDDERDEHQDHLADVEVGAGCTEIWEHLSESRAGGD